MPARIPMLSVILMLLSCIAVTATAAGDAAARTAAARALDRDGYAPTFWFETPVVGRLVLDLFDIRGRHLATLTALGC